MKTATGKYQINYYELDLPIASNFRSRWPAVYEENSIVINSNRDDALLFDCVVNSIFHPMLGKIQGMYPAGLDYIIVLEDFSQIMLEAEESPGLLYRDNKFLEPNFFKVTLWNPKFTDIPYKYAYGGLTRGESEIIWKKRDTHIREKLKIGGENDAPS